MRFSTISLYASMIAFAAADAGKGGKSPEKAPDAPPPKEGGVAEKIAEASGTQIAVAATIFDASAPTALINGKKFKVKQITRAVFQQVVGQTLTVQIVGKIFKSDRLENETAEQKKMEPPMMAEVLNLETGELGLIIMNEVLLREVRKRYPDDSYVGKYFGITMKAVNGKRYKNFVLFELEPDTAE